MRRLALLTTLIVVVVAGTPLTPTPLHAAPAHRVVLPEIRTGTLPTYLVAGQSNALMPWLGLLEQRLPATYVQTAEGNTRIKDWVRGSPLYARMVERARGHRVTAVLWWQGESDVQAGILPSDYQAALAALALAVEADLGAPLVVAALGPMDARYKPGDVDRIRLPQRDCWRVCPNIRPGPDFADVVLDGDGTHFRSDAASRLAAERWRAALVADGLAH